MSVLSKRIAHGIREELLELVTLKGVGRIRARKLYEHGYKSLYDLLVADEREILRIPGFGPALVKAIKQQLKSATNGKKEDLEEKFEEIEQVSLEEYLW